MRTADLRTRLGGALLAVAATDRRLTSEVRAAKFAEAEALLLESYQTLRSAINLDRVSIRDTLTRLIRLYDMWTKPDKASIWQQERAAFDAAA